MIKRPSFDSRYINQELDKLSEVVTTPITIFVIGGLAVINYGLKVATKDIDVVLTRAGDFETLVIALGSAGYNEPPNLRISRHYQEMEISKIMENKDKFRWDIFAGKICNKLTFSDNMTSRSIEFYSKACLTIKIAAKEDVFLFKGITNRDADLDDMRLIAESGLDWEAIRIECRHQSEASGRLWEDALVQNLIDLREKYGIFSPVEIQLKKLCEDKMGESAIIDSISSGHKTIKSISEHNKMPEYLVREYVSKAERKNLVGIDRSNRPYQLSLLFRKVT